ALAACVITGCRGARVQSTGSVAPSNELRWVKAWGIWARATRHAALVADRAFYDLEAADRDRRVRTSLPALRRCDAARDLPKPTTSVRSAYDMSVGACRQLRAAASSASGLLNGEEAAVERVATRLSRGEELLEDAREVLNHRLTYVRRLPSMGGVTGRSRIEPLFSRVA